MAYKDELQELLNKETVNIDDVLSLTGKHFIPKAEYNKKTSELKTLQEEIEAEKTKNLTVEQQLQAKLDKALKEAESSRKEFVLKSNTLEIEKMFTQAGVSEDDYKDLLGSIVGEDLEKSSNTAKTFINILEKKINATKESTTQELLVNTPEPKTGGKPDSSKASVVNALDDAGNTFEFGVLPD